MQLNTGLGGGFALAAWPGTAGTNANATPQGPYNAAHAGFGTTAGGGGKLSGHTGGGLSVGTVGLGPPVARGWALPGSTRSKT